MAQLRANVSKATYNIRKFRGLNEIEDGSIPLKDGEASVMRNFRITDGGALTPRPTLYLPLQLGNAYNELGRYDISLGELTARPASDFIRGAQGYIQLYASYKLTNDGVKTDGERLAVIRADAQPDPAINLAYFEFDGKTYMYSGYHPTYWFLFTQEMYPTGEVQELRKVSINGKQATLAVANHALFRLEQQEDSSWFNVYQMRGVHFDGKGHLFEFGDKVYILTGKQYLSWDGSDVQEVEGYVPCVLTACEPASGTGTTYERINLLSQKRKCRYSANGTATVYNILEQGVTVTEVKVNGEVKTPGTDYTAATSKVTFVTAPLAGTENVEITYSLPDNQTQTWNKTVGSYEDRYNWPTWEFLPADYGMEFSEFELYRLEGETELQVAISPLQYSVIAHRKIELKFNVHIGEKYRIKYKFRTPREQVLAMRFSELYNGSNENRVFLYGDGTNKTIYSGLTEEGQPTAEYFPDLNECRVGSSNSPITAMVKHYNRLLVFKDNEAYSIYYNIVSLADGSTTAGFYITSVNKAIGCCADAQAVLVENRVRTLDGADIYEWRATNNSGNITLDQRNANRITQRVYATLKGFNLKQSKLFYDKLHHEFYCLCDGKALVQNLEEDAWYYYDGVPITAMVDAEGYLICGTSDGKLGFFNRNLDPDFETEWVSGSLDFDRPSNYKLSPQIWVQIKPENNKTVEMSVVTENGEKLSRSVSTPVIGSVSPTLTTKIKPKRFIRYKLGLKTADRMTFYGASVSVSYTLNVK